MNARPARSSLSPADSVPDDPLLRFDALNRLICRNRHYWQFRPFSLLELPWQTSDPQLCDWLEQLSDAQVEHLEHSPQQLSDQLLPFVSDSEELANLSRLAAAPKQPESLPPWLSYHIPGRKWQQIQAFEQLLGEQQLPYLEWCSGKGHLGRLLAYRRGRKVRSLELNSELCEQGRQLAASQQLDIQFLNLNALSDEAAGQLAGEQHAVALHACGELHLQLIRKACEQHTSALSLSPCCYHLITDDYYQPLSEPGRHSGLRLDHHDLRLPLQETVTAGRRTDRLRRQEVSWRLGFDLLQREVRGCDSYLNTPSIRKSLLGGSFGDYCLWVAGHKGLKLPENVDYPRYEALGNSRYHRVQRMELVRHLFRRPLELWLVLDRALYLQQQGYRTTVSEFCERQLTPRNILIQAFRR